MQVLIYKAGIKSAHDDPYSLGLAAGDTAKLRLENDGAVSVTAITRSRWPFGIGRKRQVVIGKLGDQATEIIRPYLDLDARIRVRIVEIEPPHLNRNHQSGIYISVWGEPMDIKPNARPKNKNRIFSPSRINKPPE